MLTGEADFSAEPKGEGTRWRSKQGCEEGVVRGSDAAFPKEEFDARQRRLKRALAAAGIDLYLTSGAENIFWLSGQQTPGYYTFQCLAVPAKGAAFLMLRVDWRRTTRARIRTCRASSATRTTRILPTRWRRSSNRTWIQGPAHRDRSQRLVPHREPARSVAADGSGPLEDGGGMVEPLRRVKRRPRACRDSRRGARQRRGHARGSRRDPRGSDGERCRGRGHACRDQGGLGVRRHGAVRRLRATVGPSLTQPGAGGASARAIIVVLGDRGVSSPLPCRVVSHRGGGPRAGQGARLVRGVPGKRSRRARRCCAPGRTCADVHHAVQAVIDAAGCTEAFRKRSGYSIGVAFAPDWGEGNILSLYRGVDMASSNRAWSFTCRSRCATMADSPSR